VTFLALGNGAGDLFSIWTAVVPPNGNASLALGQIAGPSGPCQHAS
jgi:Ca2+/Na+ antiporter